MSFVKIFSYFQIEVVRCESGHNACISEFFSRMDACFLNGESSPRINCCACCIAAGSRSDADGVEVCLDLFLNFLELFDDLSDYPPNSPW